MLKPSELFKQTRINAKNLTVIDATLATTVQTLDTPLFIVNYRPNEHKVHFVFKTKVATHNLIDDWPCYERNSKKSIALRKDVISEDCFAVSEWRCHATLRESIPYEVYLYHTDGILLLAHRYACEDEFQYTAFITRKYNGLHSPAIVGNNIITELFVGFFTQDEKLILQMRQPATLKHGQVEARTTTNRTVDVRLSTLSLAELIFAYGTISFAICSKVMLYSDLRRLVSLELYARVDNQYREDLSINYTELDFKEDTA